MNNHTLLVFVRIASPSRFYQIPKTDASFKNNIKILLKTHDHVIFVQIILPL